MPRAARQDATAPSRRTKPFRNTARRPELRVRPARFDRTARAPLPCDGPQSVPIDMSKPSRYPRTHARPTLSTCRAALLLLAAVVVQPASATLWKWTDD